MMKQQNIVGNVKSIPFTFTDGGPRQKDGYRPRTTINLNRRVVFILCLGLGVYGTLYLLETGILDKILVPSDKQYMSQALRDIENEMSEKNKKEH